MPFKFIEEKIFKVLMLIATLVVLSSLLLIIYSILMRGLPSLTWEMVSETPQGGYYFGKGGGVLNAITGSLVLSIFATVFAMFISIPVVLYINIYAKKNSFFVNFTRLMLDVLFGLPSIVYGAFGFTLMLFFGVKTSLFAGIVTVGFMLIPIMIRSMDEVVAAVPQGLLEASYSLGATRFETCVKVVVKQALPGILTAFLISMGRAIGDAASVLFTTGFTDFLPTSLFHQAATLPLAIFFQLGSPVPEVQDRAYASALILTIIILLISIISRWLTKRYTKHRV
jgi:phosphate transport system permease protein